MHVGVSVICARLAALETMSICRKTNIGSESPGAKLGGKGS